MEIESGKKAVTRRNIMRAARRLYEEKGIDNTAFSDIARSAGVSRSTVFNYFASTSELLTALCGEEVEDLEEAYSQNKCGGKEGIIKIFDQFIEDTVAYPQLVTQLMHTAVMSGGENNPVKMIEDLIKRNLIKDSSDNSLAEEKTILLMGAYYGLINHYHLYEIPFDAEKIKAEMKKMINSVIG